MIRILTVLFALATCFAPVAVADPPPWTDPHYPDPMHSNCAGGMGGFMFGFCDGEHYPDGSYWHQITWSGGGTKPECMIDNQPAPPTGGDGHAAGASAP